MLEVHRRDNSPWTRSRFTPSLHSTRRRDVRRFSFSWKIHHLWLQIAPANIHRVSSEIWKTPPSSMFLIFPKASDSFPESFGLCLRLSPLPMISLRKHPIRFDWESCHMSFNLGLTIYIPFNQGMNSQGSNNYTPFNWHKTGGLDWWPSFFMFFHVLMVWSMER